jgi:hypothetical protein
MVIDQRNSGVEINPAVSSAYYLDRWQATLTTASKFKIGQNAGAVTPPVGFSKYMGMTSLSSYSVISSDIFLVKQPVEGYAIADLAFGTSGAKTVTVSFWVYSSITGSHSFALVGGSSSGNVRSYPQAYTISAANTWEFKTITIPGDTGATAYDSSTGVGLQLRFGLGIGSGNTGTSGSWSTNNWQGSSGCVSIVGTSGATFYLTGVQIEAGPLATTFEQRPYGLELTLCQRYYETSGTNTYLQAAAAGFSSGSYTLGAINNFFQSYKVVKRAAPTVRVWRAGTANVINVAGSAPAVSGISATISQFSFIVAAAGSGPNQSTNDFDWDASSEL